MKVTNEHIIFENQRDRDIFLELLREVDVGELRPEIRYEGVVMLENILRKVSE